MGMLKSEKAYLKSHLSRQSVCFRCRCNTAWMLTRIAHHNLLIMHISVSLVLSRTNNPWMLPQRGSFGDNISKVGEGQRGD